MTGRKAWTVDSFLLVKQEGRYEFDGSNPVEVRGGTLVHSRICANIVAACHDRLRGRDCSAYGINVGVAAGRSIRYPDAVLTSTPQRGTDLLVAQPLAVFEVLSPPTDRINRFTKVHEYAAVQSIRYYVQIESCFAGVTVLHRADGRDGWTDLVLTEKDTFALPEAGIEFPVAELYEDVDFPPEE